jgi:Cd2+/Zn2+-exporting ATPase
MDMRKNKQRYRDSAFLPLHQKATDVRPWCGGLLTGNPIYFWFDAALIAVSFLILLIDISGLVGGSAHFILLAVISVIGLMPVLLSALRALANRRLTIDLLASIALIFSLLAQEWRSAIFISIMLASARIFARYTENRAKRSIQGLLKLRPAKVHRLIDGKPVETKVEDVKVGDLILVEAGERIAVDGFVESGEASVDQSSLTGESVPLAKKAGDAVFSSTLNTTGSLVMKAEKIGKDTTFSKILELVEKSQSSKTPIVSISEHFTRWYILITLLAVLLIYYLSHNLILVLSILLVTCADDIAVAVPLAFTAAIGKAARAGIIIKGGNFLEGLTKIKTIVFDKTGTLTEGKLKEQNILTFNNYSFEKFLLIAGTIESESNHPSAKAICRYVSEKKINLSAATEVHEDPGYGIEGRINGEWILAGKIKFLAESGVKFSENEANILEREKNQSRTVVVFSVDKIPIGFISLADNLRPDAKHLIDGLKAQGIKKLVMLTGDNEIVAKEVAQKIGLPDFEANLMPDDKIKYLKSLGESAGQVAMVGDGVNDAPALTQADIGIAMGAIGSDAAIENADIVLMKDKLSDILAIMNLSRYTMKVVYQNLFLWGVINTVGLFLVFEKFLGPGGAAAYNFLTDFLPLLNSLKLFRHSIRA